MVKFPSIIRLPRSKTFTFSPRHFDPIKDEIAERTARIKREMALEEGVDPKEKGTHEQYAPTISFRKKERSNNNASLLQLAIATVLGGLVVGWLYYGDKVFYALFLVFPVYLYFRLKGRFGKRK